MGVVKKLHRALWSDVAVDLGTVNTLVYMTGRGVVLDEPSVLAVDSGTGEVVGVGKAAASLYGRAPEGVDVIKPLHDGVISDPDACSLMLDAFLRRICRHHRLGRPDALVCVPGCATSVERRALARAVGTGDIHFHVTLVQEPVAAALGCDIDLSDGRRPAHRRHRRRYDRDGRGHGSGTGPDPVHAGRGQRDGRRHHARGEDPAGHDDR